MLTVIIKYVIILMDGRSDIHSNISPLTERTMDSIQAMAEVLLYGALLLGICMLLATRSLDPVEVGEEDPEAERLRSRRNPRE